MNTLVDEAHLFAGFLDTFTAIYPQLQGIDFRVDAKRLEVPVYLVEGAHEGTGRSGTGSYWRSCSPLS